MFDKYFCLRVPPYTNMNTSIPTIKDQSSSAIYKGEVLRDKIFVPPLTTLLVRRDPPPKNQEAELRQCDII
jgi:hypothetical protein